MENSINKTRAAHLILSAVSDTLTTDASAFMECCDRHDNLTAAVIAAFADLDYREQRVISMRLGFDARQASPLRRSAGIGRLQRPLS